MTDQTGGGLPTSPQASVPSTQPAPQPAPPVDPTQQNTSQPPVPAQTIDPTQPTSRRQKEVIPPTSVDTTLPPVPENSLGESENLSQTVESVTTGPVEIEPPKELEPEIEKVVERIQDKKIAGAKETVVAAETMPQSAPKTVAQTVVVLPLTEKGMKQGKHKSPQNSVRWLYEWCVRQIRKLRDFLVVYRED